MAALIFHTRSSTAAHILELAYIKLRHPAVITANCTQIPLHKQGILSNVSCIARAYLKNTFCQMCITISGRLIPNEGRIGSIDIKVNALYKLNLAQISCKMGIHQYRIVIQMS